MELQLKLFFLITVLVVLLQVSQAHGRYRKTKFRIKYRHRPVIRKPKIKILKVKPTPSPTTQNLTIITEEQCNIIVDKLPKKDVPGPICLRLNEAQLLAKLKDDGNYNPRYMAINIKEALLFPNLTLDQLPLPTNLSVPTEQQNISLGNQSDMKMTKRQKRSVGQSTTIRFCNNQGPSDELDPFQLGMFTRLCTECSATTQLEAGVFPPFINEVLCDSEECFGNLGGCQQQFITFTFIRRTGNFELDDDVDDDDFEDDVFVEVLETFQQQIRICCQCRAFSFVFSKK